MDDSGYLNPHHLSYVTRVWNHTTCNDFEIWSFDQNKDVRKYRDLLDVIDANALDPNNSVDRHQMIKNDRHEYKQLLDAG